MPLFELEGERVKTPASGKFWVAPNAMVIGKVTLGEDSSVWYSCVIRGDNEPISIGARTNVQEGCVLHTDPGFPMDIGEDVTVGHMAMLHGATIGDGALIGIGAVILNGAKIGKECLIGAKALIPEGKEIPPRSVVMGAPGKVIRELSDADVARMSRASSFYVGNWKRFAEKLKPQA